MPVLSFPPTTMGLSRADFGNHVRERNGWIARKRSAQLNEAAVEQSAHRFPSIAAGSAGETVGLLTHCGRHLGCMSLAFLGFAVSFGVLD